MKPSQLRIIPTTTKVVEGLKLREDYVNSPGSTPSVGIKGKDTTSQDVPVVGKCERFDLSEQKDREAYACLTARLFSGADCIKLWEEKTQQNGALIVYVCYINYMNVFQNPAHHINFKE